MSEENPFDELKKPSSASKSKPAAKKSAPAEKRADKPSILPEVPSAAEDAPNPPSFDDVTAEEIRKTEAAAAKVGIDKAPEQGEPVTKEAKPATRKKKVDFNKAVSEKGVLSASSGQVSAVIDMNHVAVPVLKVSMVGWVGPDPLVLEASAIADIRKVLDELEKQAS